MKIGLGWLAGIIIKSNRILRELMGRVDSNQFFYTLENYAFLWYAPFPPLPRGVPSSGMLHKKLFILLARLAVRTSEVAHPYGGLFA